MAVRVKIEINISGDRVQTTAVVNTGFETSNAQILVPITLIKKALSKKMTESRVVEYETAGGVVKFSFLGKADVKVICKDKESDTCQAEVIASEHANEVLLNDILTERLGIVPYKPGRGKWRFINETKERESEPPERW